jgi:nucleotide-binding universal stress UspA family protein
MTDTSATPARIVVGIDGSDSSKEALAWAARQARLTASPLHVVIAWEIPTTYGWAAPLPDNLDFEADAEAVVKQEIEEVIGGDATSRPDVTYSVVEGHPAAVLLHEAESASLVVVGSRGHGAFAGMMLGSVGLHLASRADCPVLIVRDGSEATATR